MTSNDSSPGQHRSDSPEDTEARIAEILAAPSYKLAFEDADYLLRDELRPSRLALEYLKPELIQQELNIQSTIVVFGGTRVIAQADAEQKLQAARTACTERPDDAELERDLHVAERVLAKARYYDVAREFARLVSAASQTAGRRDFAVVTGGGPGIMEAANRGAHDVGAKSIGLNITLPHEQAPNSYISPELCFQFRYFAIRKLHFMMRAKALVAMPGGYGTMDELFEALTLIQTHKVEPIPVVLCGREFWQHALDLPYLAAEGVIAYKDLDLFCYAETAQEIWDQIRSFYRLP